MKIALLKADDPMDATQGWLKMDIEIKTINDFMEKFAKITGDYVFAEVYETSSTDNQELVNLIKAYLAKNFPRAPRVVISALFDSAKKVIDAAGIKITAKVEDSTTATLVVKE
jgi:hypothetical protein